MIRPQMKRQKDLRKYREALQKGDKVVIGKYKRRKDMRRKTGHRQQYLRVKITEIAS